MKTLLNDNQLRSLRVTLRQFEEYLRQADAYLRGAPEDGTLYHYVLPLSVERREAAQRRIQEALAGIAELSVTLALESEPADVCATIRATMSACWADLVDARAAGLKRYGPMDPELAPMLDPIVAHMAELALSISALMDPDK